MRLQANPFAFEFELSRTALVIIDMQRDFIEPGGFGETLGNDVSRLSAIVPACREVLAAWRAADPRHDAAVRRLKEIDEKP